MKIAKITRVHPAEGFETKPEDVDFSESRIAFPESSGNKIWRIYLPLHGFESVGPWYFWNDITEECVALRPDRTYPVTYLDSDLHLAPFTSESLLFIPEPVMGKLYAFTGNGCTDLAALQDALAHRDVPHYIESKPKPGPRGLDHRKTWICENHPPGSEIEVNKGESCYCGRVE